MTQQKKLKQLIRTRMAKTGESYTTANGRSGRRERGCGKQAVELLQAALGPI